MASTRTQFLKILVLTLATLASCQAVSVASVNDAPPAPKGSKDEPVYEYDIDGSRIIVSLPSETTADDPNRDRPKVGLVLSGGGAKGIAHIRIIEAIEDAGIPIDYIAGTSMGAIIGGLYSIGYTPQELDSLVTHQDWLALLSDHVARKDQLLSQKEISDTYLLSVPFALNKKFSIPSGVLAGQNVLNLLNELTIGYHDDNLDFDSLPIPFACVAYDMVKAQEVVYRSGNLPLAIRASMSIPGAFEPVLRDSMVLVDGGIYNNFPVDVVRDMGADIVIGVDLATGLHDQEGLSSLMGLIDQITTILGRQQYAENLKHVDLYLKPYLKPYTSSSFSSEAVDSLLIRGQRCADDNREKILALRERIYPDSDYMYVRPEVPDNTNTSIRIGNIKFVGLTRNEETFIRPTLGIKENSTITVRQLNDAIAKLRGSGAFSYVTYSLESTMPHTLTISVDEKQQAVVNAGFRFDTEQMASIMLNTTLSLRGLQGPRIGLSVRLNDNPYVKLDLNTSNILKGRLGLSYMFKSNNYRLYKNGEKVNNVTFGQNRVNLFFTLANPVKFNPQIGISYEHFNYSSFLFASDDDRIAVKPEGFVNYYVTGYLETLNDHYFPTRGVLSSAKIALHTDNGYGYNNGSPFLSVEYGFRNAISLTDRFTIMPSVYGRTLIGNEVAYSYYNYVGGDLAGRFMDQQIPFVGIKHLETVDRSVFIVGLEARMRLFVRHFISFKVNYGIQNDNFFKMFTDRHDMLGFALKYAYNSPIGPISLQFDISNVDRSFGIYFSLGKDF